MRYRELRSEADHESKGSNDSRGFAGELFWPEGQPHTAIFGPNADKQALHCAEARTKKKDMAARAQHSTA